MTAAGCKRVSLTLFLFGTCDVPIFFFRFDFIPVVPPYEIEILAFGPPIEFFSVLERLERYVSIDYGYKSL